GSWCGPCRAEAPDLARLARETAARGVRFVGIDTRDTAAAAKAFVRFFHVPYPSIVDEDGRVLLAFRDVIPVSAIPSTLVVDTDGNIAAKVVGQVTYSTLRGLVEDELPARMAGDGSQASTGPSR
ncbi:MAG: TlpA family protein disulfide reductase, partial [Propionibacteriales bacterium]|nr:TlpA family protein disulfide reductase [Propionibacteriales bacterium]